MIKKAPPPVGIIAEDDSDFISARVLVKRIALNNNIKFHKFFGKGCGKIKKKCHAWSNELSKRGCKTLVLIHDSDSKRSDDLREMLRKALAPCPIKNHLICIPVQEFEAWLLSDPEAIKKGLNLRKKPIVKGLPENINSPKEHLELLVDRASNGEKIYINTKHNIKIAELLSITKAMRLCPSFAPFYKFIHEYIKTA
jgi:Domain of unknown function (DUF4276)